MLSISVHKDFGKRGIGKNMTKLLLQNIKEKGFWIAWAECSSNFSTRALESHGCKVEKSIDYATYRVDGGCCGKTIYPFAAAQEPHTKVNLLVKRFK